MRQTSFIVGPDFRHCPMCGRRRRAKRSDHEKSYPQCAFPEKAGENSTSIFWSTACLSQRLVMSAEGKPGHGSDFLLPLCTPTWPAALASGPLFPGRPEY